MSKRAFIVIGMTIGAIIYYFTGSYVYSISGGLLLYIFSYWRQHILGNYEEVPSLIIKPISTYIW